MQDVVKLTLSQTPAEVKLKSQENNPKLSWNSVKTGNNYRK